MLLEFRLYYCRGGSKWHPPGLKRVGVVVKLVTLPLTEFSLFD